MKFRCPRCKRDGMREIVRQTLLIPVGWRNLSKAGIRSGKVELWGVDWSNAVVICMSCGWRSDMKRGRKKSHA